MCSRPHPDKRDPIPVTAALPHTLGMDRGSPAPIPVTATQPLPRRPRSPSAGDPPCGGALPHVAHQALEGLGAVAEGADAAVPVPLVRGGFRLPLRPAETHARQGQHRPRRARRPRGAPAATGPALPEGPGE